VNLIVSMPTSRDGVLRKQIAEVKMRGANTNIWAIHWLKKDTHNFFS